MSEQKIIGTMHNVQLPGYSVVYIPAKIDTGADDSAIWASSINEDTGELSFVLFAPQSVFYTGELIKTRDYKVASIKNSFGISEYRYKVKLKMKIANKIYRASFNLSDRSNNRFPILIGKKFLRHRFVVDVSKHDVGGILKKSTSQSPIVILKSVIDAKTKTFFDMLSQKLSSELILENYRSLQFEISENCEPKILLPDGLDIASARIVYFKSHNLYPEHANAVVRYLQYKHVPFFDKELANFVSSSKLSEMFILATNKVPVPKSIIITGINNLPSYDELKLLLGENIVIKDATADRGNNNYIVKDDKSYSEALGRFENTRTFIVQRYIENDGFLRVLIMGGKVIQIIKRYPALHKDPLKSHLNKPHGGLNAVELDVDDYDSEVVSLARKASLAMKRNIVGVDLIQDKNTQKWYVLEANNNPDIVNGVDVSQKIEGLAKLLESNDR